MYFDSLGESVDKELVKIDVYSKSFSGGHAIPSSIADFLRTSSLICETTDSDILSEFDLYLHYMINKRVKNKLKNLRFSFDLRAAVVLNFADGSTSYIAGGLDQYVICKEQVYEDNKYSFLALLNSKFELPGLREFLSDKQLALPIKITDKRLIKIDIYSMNFSDATTSSSIIDLVQSRYLNYETADPIIINAFNSYLSYMRNQREEKRKRRWTPLDIRVVAVLNYSDGSNSFIAGGADPRIICQDQVYTDKEYNFLILMNSRFELKSLTNFLAKKGIIK